MTAPAPRPTMFVLRLIPRSPFSGFPQPLAVDPLILNVYTLLGVSGRLMVVGELARTFEKRTAPRKLQSFSAAVHAAAPTPAVVTTGSSNRSTVTVVAARGTNTMPAADSCNTA